MIGQTLSHYRILAKIGAGGMGEVYRAEDTKLGREIALKVLPEEMASDRQRLSRFQQEAKTVAALNHPNIVTIFSVEEADGVHFLTMELVAGETLDDLLPSSGLPLDRFFALATPIADAVASAHARGIVHRDLKPGNVMVTDEGERVKVLDFGLAKLAGTGPGGDADGASRLLTLTKTQEGLIVGTPHYMSPEQARGETVDHRSDIFSLGVMLFEMATGRRPFQGESSIELLSSVLKDAPPALTEVKPELPRHLGRVIGRCLAKEPADRYQTALDVYNELRALRQELRAEESPDSTGTGEQDRAATQEARRTRVTLLPGLGSQKTPRIAAAAGLVLAALIVAFVSFKLASDRQAPEPPAGLEPAAAKGPSIAVLPFVNAGGDPEQEYFSNGLTEDIITELSRYQNLRVIARHSTLQYKEGSADVRRVGDELGVRYVVEGSVRRAGEGIRVTARLLDARDGGQLWGDRFDRDSTARDLFSLQDELTEQVVAAIAGSYGPLSRAELAEAQRKPPASLDSYDCVLRAYEYLHVHTAENHLAARNCLEGAVEADPDYPDAWAWLGYMYAEEHQHQWNARPDAYDPLERALEVAERGVSLDPTSQGALAGLALTHYVRGDLERFRIEAGRAIALNPNNPLWLAALGSGLVQRGEFELGLPMVHRALELNPHPPPWLYIALFLDHYHGRRYEAALAEARKITAEDYRTQLFLAAAYGQLGRPGEAGRELAKADKLKPGFSRVVRQDFLEHYRYPADITEHLLEGLGKAGMRDGVAGSPKLAVLPLEDLSPEADQDWFAAGVHEALLRALQQIDGLRVTSRRSAMRYRGSDQLLPEIARELGVAWLVEGSVVRVDDRVRVSAQLIDGALDQQVWSEQYERNVRDVLALQSEFAQAIAKKIQVVLTPDEEERLTAAPRVDPEGYGRYVRGLQHFDRITPTDFTESVDYFEQAIALDPAFAPAHAALAVAYGIAVEYGWVARAEAAPRAERAAATALSLAPGSGDAHHALASVLFHMDRDFPGAEESYRTALQLSSSSQIYFGYGWLLSQMGRHREAVEALERAVELDPRSALMHGDLGWWLYGARRFDRTIDEAKIAIQLDPRQPESHWLLAAAYSQKGQFDLALDAFSRYEELYGDAVPWFRGYLHALAGQRDRAMTALRELEGRVDRGESPSIERAQIFLGLGDDERTLQVLEEADEAGVSFQPYLWPEYERLLTEPRFVRILTRLGYPSPSTLRPEQSRG